MGIPKPTIPKGTRDFSPEEMVRRNYIFDVIKNVFQRHGYLPIETPAMENLDTLMGKYGREGDRLIFKILLRGEKLKQELKVISDNKGDFQKDKSHDYGDTVTSGEKDIQWDEARASSLSDEALRYDLTVPFARYVVMHQNEITFPFKRYQVQPVWRADRPQKGRYREFFQCDADVIGSDSLLNEAELVQIIREVFSGLNINIVIKINNRKILTGIAELIGEKDKIVDITIAIDKLEKIGLDGVNKELKEKGIAEEAILKLQPIITLTGTTVEKISSLKNILSSSASGMKGVEEMEYLFNIIEQQTSNNKPQTEFCELDLTLARGLNYYTGAIFEVKATEGALASSICGGGRYDDLTGIFGLPNVSGVGISFGADRIYDVLHELNRFPEFISASTFVLFVNFGEAEIRYCLPLAAQLREMGINAEIYPDNSKLKKQMSYADAKKIPYVVLAGSEEVKTGNLTLKNMKSGEQSTHTKEELLKKISSLIFSY